MSVVRTVRYGEVPIRKKFTDGKVIDCIDLTGDGHADIRVDYRTGELFAVLLNEDFEEEKE